MEHEQTPNYTITELTMDTCDAANEMRLRSWLDTYTNEKEGVTREWILNRNKSQMSDEVRERRRKRLEDPHSAGWVALDDRGEVIGMTSPYIDDEGRQHVGSLYVDKNWHGKGVGAALMQKVVDWSDAHEPIELGVVSYNQRAIAFYRKWGFEVIPESDDLFEGVIPEVKMTRKGDLQ